MIEVGADADGARSSRSSSSSSPSRYSPSIRLGLLGDPATTSSVVGDLGSVVDGPGPNRNPPDKRRPCFFDILPIRRRVFAVDEAKVLVVVRGEEVRIWSAGGISADIDLGAIGSGSTPSAKLLTGPWSMNPLHTSPFHARACPYPILGAGSAETGLIFFRLGVRSTSSVSVSVSLPSRAGITGYDVE